MNKSESNEVALEIKSHPGIIIALNNNNYEFPHLVTQEYLAAEFIVRQPFSNKIFEFFNINPSILAPATCLSTDSERYFSNIFLNTKFSPISNNSAKQTAVYLRRLQTENINFRTSIELGATILFLYYKYRRSVEVIEVLNNWLISKRLCNPCEKH